MPDQFRLDGQTALVTGAASGIGESVVRKFVAAGAHVIAVDIDEERVARVVDGLSTATSSACDVTDLSQVQRLFRSLVGLDILVNCAGIGSVGSVEETELEEFQRLFRVNVDGTYLMIKYAMPLLLKARGSILNIGSIAGLVGLKRRFAYCSSKGTIIAMTRQLAIEYATQLRVNCIAPGTVDTPFVEAYLEKYHRHEKEEVRQQLNQRQPVGRLGQPDEIADLALYISSPAAAFMTGSIVTIDGGLTAG